MIIHFGSCYIVPEQCPLQEFVILYLQFRSLANSQHFAGNLQNFYSHSRRRSECVVLSAASSSIFASFVYVCSLLERTRVVLGCSVVDWLSCGIFGLNKCLHESGAMFISVATKLRERRGRLAQPLPDTSALDSGRTMKGKQENEVGVSFTTREGGARGTPSNWQWQGNRKLSRPRQSLLFYICICAGVGFRCNSKPPATSSPFIVRPLSRAEESGRGCASRLLRSRNFIASPHSSASSPSFHFTPSLSLSPLPSIVHRRAAA